MFKRDHVGASATEHYYHNDHLGTSQRLSNGAGEITWRAYSEAFGKTVVDTSFDFVQASAVVNNATTGGMGVSLSGVTQITLPITSAVATNNLRFPGQYFDGETGTSYNYFRDYDASMGRYVQSDPIGLGGGMNYFEYGLSNPTYRFDVFGLCAFMGWVQVTKGSEFKTENADKLVSKFKVLKPKFDVAQCSFTALFPLLPGMPFNPKLPPCLPKFEVETWAWWKRAFQQFSREYEVGYYLYVCHPENCQDEGIRKQWARRNLSNWKLDFERVTNRFDFQLWGLPGETSSNDF